MSSLTLVIGSKTFSSWSLRPWLFLKHHHVAFEEVLIPLNTDETRKQILEHSPSGKVPLLHHGTRRVWESLAICEYAAETLGLLDAWPADPDARAFARAIATEMHAGFADLRNELPFEANRDPERKMYSARAAADITRIRSLWREARGRHGSEGEWLFGRFGIVDAMFAPVALRFFVYDIPLDGVERDYMDSVVLHPSVQAWMEAATLENPVREGPHARTQEIPPAVLAAAQAMNPLVQHVAPAPPAQQPVPAAKAEAAPKPKPAAPKIKSFLLPPD